MILVVDDNQAIRETLRDILEDEGFKVATATNGADALGQLESLDDVRMVILDLMMPVMDGWELRRRMSADTRFAETPVIVLSAVADDVVLPDDFGAVAVLRKPLPMGTLLTLVSRFDRPERSEDPFFAMAGGGLPRLPSPAIYGQIATSLAGVACR